MEIHQIISAANTAALLEKERNFLDGHKGYKVSLKRYFLSEREQISELGKSEGPVSYVIQPVLGDDNIAVWIFLVKDYPVELLWHTNFCSIKEGSEAQTREILETYESELAIEGLCIKDDCVRTWFYVDDVDNNYTGLVVARKENFEAQGMTKDTHYLASTGISGYAVKPGTIVQMDALAVKGAFSQYYLYAPQNFNPTYEYGVTFERGVVLKYGGESHILISGTASINNKGEIVCPGDVVAQTHRMLENVEALLGEADSSWRDVRMMVVYLRNAGDYSKVAPIFEDRFGSDIPFVITLAPVCRPGWLIETECIAVKQALG